MAPDQFAEQRWRERQSSFEATHSCDECRVLIEQPTCAVTLGSATWTAVPRYHCTDCSNYDVCVACYPKRLHDPTHAFSLDYFVPREVGQAVQGDPALRTNLAASQLAILHAFADRRCLGWRTRQGAPRWIKYRTVSVMVANAARALALFSADHSGAAASLGSRTDLTRSQVVTQTAAVRTAAIVGPNCPEWIMADWACALRELPVCPLYTTMRDDVLCECIATSQVWIVFVSLACLPKLAHATALPDVTHVVVLDADVEPGDERVALPSRPSVVLLTWSQLMLIGEEAPEALAPPPRQPGDLYTVIFTSGSTGKPKGVMHAMEGWMHSLTRSPGYLNDPMVDMSFAPMAHSSPRRFVWQTLACGGRVWCINDDMYPPDADKMDVLIREAQFCSPVVLSSTPRLWNALYARYCQLLERNKAAWPEKDARAVRTDTLAQCRNLLGTRLRFATIGGGSSSAEVQEWMFDCFQCIVNNGFGATETGGIASGGPGMPLHFAPMTQWKIESIPELGYFVDGHPPRGELLIKTPSMALGYWKNPTQTRAAWRDGYFSTGDVVEVRTNAAGAQEVVIVDRAKNFIKLAQGVFVAVEHLESLYGGCATVSQICVHAEPVESFLVAVVVPNADVVRMQLHLGPEVSSEALCAMPAVEECILREMAAVALREQLQGFEMPRGLLLTPVAWTSENGLMTGSIKVDRRAIAARFATELSACYSALSSVQTRLQSILHNVLGVQATVAGQQTFADLGGDSLRAQQLQQQVERELGVQVPISFLLGQKPLDDVAQWVEARVGDQADLVASSMGGEANAAGFVDFAASARLPTGLRFGPASSVPAPAHYLLTGATGFLGMYVLQRLLGDGSAMARVSCVVRAKNAAHALERLQLKLAEAEVRVDWTRVDVLVGDCAEPRLGLEAATWDALCENVTVVVHVAALVNSRLSYNQLYASNAGSTRECIALCGTGRAGKRLVYVSTAGCVYPYCQQGLMTGLRSQGRLPQDPSYRGGGYSASKLAGEVACYAARDAGLDVVILRPSTIVPTAATGGWFNADDTYSRILMACALQGSYPVLGPEHTINVVPVTWVAHAVVAAAVSQLSDAPILNLVSTRSLAWSSVFEQTSQLQPLSFRDWARRLEALAATDSTHPLHSTLERYARVFPYLGDWYQGTSCVRSDATTASAVGAAPLISAADLGAHWLRVAAHQQQQKQRNAQRRDEPSQSTGLEASAFFVDL